MRHGQRSAGLSTLVHGRQSSKRSVGIGRRRERNLRADNGVVAAIVRPGRRLRMLKESKTLDESIVRAHALVAHRNHRRVQIHGNIVDDEASVQELEVLDAHSNAECIHATLHDVKAHVRHLDREQIRNDRVLTEEAAERRFECAEKGNRIERNARLGYHKLDAATGVNTARQSKQGERSPNGYVRGTRNLDCSHRITLVERCRLRCALQSLWRQVGGIVVPPHAQFGARNAQAAVEERPGLRHLNSQIHSHKAHRSDGLERQFCQCKVVQQRNLNALAVESQRRCAAANQQIQNASNCEGRRRRRIREDESDAGDIRRRHREIRAHCHQRTV
eukprot:Opistho-2@93514